jgi:ABC-type transport system involved in cytochrome c biogenesis permease subunit
MIEANALWGALLAYVAAGVVSIVALLLGKRPDRTVLGLLVGGLALHTLSLALRWERVGHGPFITMFEILSSNLWSLMLVFAFAYWRFRPIRPIAAIVLPILFVMMGWLLTTSPVEGHFPPTYRTIWLYVHVGLGKVFLGAVLVSVGLSAVVLLRAFGLGGRLARLPADDRLDDLSFRFVALGLIFETLMLVTGAIWAQDAWGRFWSWDPLETWALLTWLLLAFTIHLRVTVTASPRVGAALIVAVFALAFLTFFGIPFISTAPHKGAV